MGNRELLWVAVNWITLCAVAVALVTACRIAWKSGRKNARDALSRLSGQYMRVEVLGRGDREAFEGRLLSARWDERDEGALVMEFEGGRTLRVARADAVYDETFIPLLVVTGRDVVVSTCEG